MKKKRVRPFPRAAVIDAIKFIKDIRMAFEIHGSSDLNDIPVVWVIDRARAVLDKLGVYRK